MKEESLREVETLDRDYFGKRPLPRLISALMAQIVSMQKEPTTVNVRKQLGDTLFVAVSIARNMGWDLDELLEEVIVKVKNRKAERHYYEAHVTIEPVFDERHACFTAICNKYDFHVATLLMQKRKTATPTRSLNDAFCTGRSISYSDIEDRMLLLVEELSTLGFDVHRYKIESTLLDSRYNDKKHRLNKGRIPEKERTPRAPADGALAGRK